MQALILAAGMGKRLGELTKSNTKCMLELDGIALIDAALSNLTEVGVTKIIIVVGYKFENLIKHVGHDYLGVPVEYINNKEYENTNNIYSLYLASEKLIEDDTILLESDLIFDKEILSGLLLDKRKDLAVVDKYRSWMDGTVVTVNERHDIKEYIPRKNQEYSRIYEYYKTVNIYKLSKEFSEYKYVPFLKAYIESVGCDEYYEDVLRVIGHLDGALQAYILDGQKWYEIDDVQDKENAEIIFSKSIESKLKRLQNRYGGYWRFDDLIDFCYLVNPYFPNNRMVEEFKCNFENLLREYPSGLAVQNMLAAKHFGISKNKILVGNGASELMTFLPKIVKGNVGIVLPTFNEYSKLFGEDRIVYLNSSKNKFR